MSLIPGADLFTRVTRPWIRATDQAQALIDVMGRHATSMPASLRPFTAPTVLPRNPAMLAAEAFDYAVDATQRSVLFWDTLRRAGNDFLEHEREGCPPVLMFPYEILLDGRDLPRPCNYALTRITPPPGWPPTDPKLRPFIIIDPRAGHGAGIGGFKSDSQVGVALRRGHPVYFVVFFREPEPGQSILDIVVAKGAFLREVSARHSGAPKPVVIGNCQGGWAVMMLGATEPGLTGALVLNGAPLSYWAGEKGRNPMRYLGGLAGGSWPAALQADLGNGRFDGANLVMNFEALSPGNTWFRKYFNLYAGVDREAPRFLEFERWWGGFYLMNADEIRWIVDNLFIGDRFARGLISAGPGASFNMRSVRSPVFVFASAGDNITPPGQALRWIADVYRDEKEVKALGQTIVYLLHEDIGHLGIFVSAKVARREHREIASTIELIEALAPGLYEMVITDGDPDDPTAALNVDLVKRTVADIRALSGEAKNEAFPAVAKISALTQAAYDVLAAPAIRAAASEPAAEFRRRLHPMRLRRTLVSDLNPALLPAATLASVVREARRPAAPDNPFLAWETLWADSVERSIDLMRDWRDAWIETAFHTLYGGLAALGVAGNALSASTDPLAEPADPPEVRAALARIAEGTYAEAVVRMLILLADARGGVRRDRLARSNALLTSEPPFSELSTSARQALIREQRAIAAFAPERAVETLPQLLTDATDRTRALAVVAAVAGPAEEMDASVTAMLARFRSVLGGA
jgi:pimeloyl-ACP methyl ester carboxylesterase/tellurite resistance protein